MIIPELIDEEAETLWILRNPTRIGMYDNPSEFMQTMAVETNAAALFYIKNPCDAAIRIGLTKNLNLLRSYNIHSNIIDWCLANLSKQDILAYKNCFRKMTPEQQLLLDLIT